MKGLHVIDLRYVILLTHFTNTVSRPLTGKNEASRTSNLSKAHETRDSLSSSYSHVVLI